MELTKKQKLIYEGIICPYCMNPAIRVDDSEVYGKSYGNKLMLCRDCDAYVAYKKGRDLGRLAKKDLRKAKIKAHEHFDKLWKDQHMTRSDAYKWLSQQLGIPPKYTHIGMFSTKTCLEVIELSKQKLKKYANN